MQDDYYPYQGNDRGSMMAEESQLEELDEERELAELEEEGGELAELGDIDDIMDNAWRADGRGKNEMLYNRMRMQKNSKPTGTSGVVYVRWGRTTCPNTAEIVYTGRAGGSSYGTKGGGVNLQCLTLKPKYLKTGRGKGRGSYIYGSEYEDWSNNMHLDVGKLHNHDAPCAVCYATTRNTQLMIPATTECPQKWTLEYRGYLMAERYTNYRSTFVCVDEKPDLALGGYRHQPAMDLYFVEPRCGSLPCPPYDESKELACAVCTR